MKDIQGKKFKISFKIHELSYLRSFPFVKGNDRLHIVSSEQSYLVGFANSRPRSPGFYILI